MVNVEHRVAGFYTVTVLRPDGTQRESLTFKNLITDGGLDRMGNNADWLTWCQVGAGTNAPLATDGALGSRVAASQTRIDSTEGVASVAPYHVWTRRTYRFEAGLATGNISELGVGWLSTGGLFSRALVRDANGDPTTITVQADEALDVTYEFRYYAPAEATGSITLDGVSYAYVMRAARVTTLNYDSGWLVSGLGTSAGERPTTSSFAAVAYDGAIGAENGEPSGNAQGGQPWAALAYVGGSNRRDFKWTAGLSNANFVNGIGAASFRMGIGCYQLGFTPKIPKTADKVLELTIFTSWARA